ncbi:hypothetical protein BDD43_1650 [Mucilaginibacter gracilis]|uniref:Beta-carotene 15,15'-monooxygenase n=1 Tax=Mucilaginibacter gracilis TaxID=423350 RepID=A0A495IYB7_9SPHI|nr:DUF6427 family protein [Mucilaginibacter gracilis]RKR81503.1 hypothetical protein BDD43_1650 [Mucilaginibacter gracilis]
MIKAFRTLNPINILWLAVVLVVLRIAYVIHLPQHIAIVFVEPFARLLIPVNYEDSFSSIYNVISAGVLVFIQALWLNHIINQYSLLSKPTFLPALVYITASSLFGPFLVLSPPLICNFLILWMVHMLLELYADENPMGTAFNLGMVVAVGTLIYFPFIYMFLAIWAGLVIFRPFNWREWVAAIIGFVTIFFFLAVFYFWTDRIEEFYKIWLPLGSSFPASIQIVSYYNYLVLIPVMVILLLSFIRLRQNFFRSYILMRKAFQLLGFMFVIALLSFYVKPNFDLSHFLLCLVPVSVMFAYYFLNANKWWMYETLYFLLVMSIVYFQFNKF